MMLIKTTDMYQYLCMNRSADPFFHEALPVVSGYFINGTAGNGLPVHNLSNPNRKYCLQLSH